MGDRGEEREEGAEIEVNCLLRERKSSSERKRFERDTGKREKLGEGI